MANVDVGGVTAELAIGFQDWSRGLQEAIRDLQQFSATINQTMARLDNRTSTSSQDLAQAFKEMGKAITDSIRDASRGVDRDAARMEKSLDELQDKARETGREAGQHLSGLGQKMVGVSGVIAAALTGVGAASLSAASEIEGYQVQLETLTGSAEAAKKKLDFFRELAVTSPFSLKELVESGVALEAYGQQAEKWLPRVGDFAASMNLDVTEAARGIGKALSGSADGWEILRNAGVNGRRLAPFGASLTKEGNVDPTDSRNAQALLAFLDSLEGASAKKSETISGRFSMVGDALFNTFAKVGDQIAPIAKQIADALTTVITTVGNLPPGLLVAGAVLAGVAAGLVALGGAVLMLVPGVAALPAAFAATSTALAPFAPVLAGVALAVVALGAAAAALALAWSRNWGGIRQTVATFVEQARNFLAGFWPQVVSGFESLRATVSALWSQLWTAASQRWAAFRAEIEPGLVAVRGFFERIWPDIQRIVDMALAVLVPLVGQAFDSMVANLRAAGQILSAIWSALWSGMKAAVEIAWPLISGLVESNLAMLRGMFEAGLKLLSGDWRGAWESLTQASSESFKVLRDNFSQTFDRILEALWNFIPSIAEAGWNIGRALWDSIKSAVSASDANFSEMQATASAATAGRGMTSTAAASFASWASTTTASGAEQRRVAEQQSLWESRRARGQARREAEQAQEEARRAAAQSQAQDTSSESGGKGQSAKTRAAARLTPAERILAEAQRRVGTAFLPGQVAQCANFVRDVYAAAGVRVGATKSPMDLAQTKGLAQGPGYANSFAGRDVGQIITDPKKLRAGDVVTYANTYGSWADGTLTHAGIYAGNGQVVHRGTREGSVSRVALEDPGRFAYGVRPYSIGGDKNAGQMEAAKKKIENLGSEVGKLLVEQIDRQISFLEEMSSQRIKLMTSDTERERAELDKRFADMVAYWERVKTQTPGLAAQAEEQITLVRQAEVEQRAALDRAQWERQHEEALANQEWQVQMGRETHEDLTAFLAQQLEAWQGTEDGKRALMLKYRDAFKADLDAMREAQAEFDEEDLARMVEVLQAKTDLTVAERIRLDELLAELDVAQNEKMLQWQSVAESVSQAFQSSFTSAFVGVLSGQQTFAQGMKTIWQSLVQTILTEIAKVIAKLLALRAMQILTGFFFPVGAVGGGAGSGLGSSVGALVSGGGGGGGGGISPIATGLIPMYHDGGVVGLGNLRSDEVLAKLQRGEVVLSRETVGNLGRAAGAGGGPAVNLTIQNLHNNGPQDVAAMARDLGRRTSWYLQGA